MMPRLALIALVVATFFGRHADAYSATASADVYMTEEGALEKKFLCLFVSEFSQLLVFRNFTIPYLQFLLFVSFLEFAFSILFCNFYLPSPGAYYICAIIVLSFT